MEIHTVLFSPFLVEGQHGGAVVVHDAADASACHLGGGDRLFHVGEVAVREGRARPADALPSEPGEQPLRHHPDDVVEVEREAARPHAAQAQRRLHHHAHLHLPSLLALYLPSLLILYFVSSVTRTT